MEAQRELAHIRGELGNRVVIETELQLTALHLGKALLSWPNDQLREAGDLEDMEASLTQWCQVAIQLKRLQQHSALDHNIFTELHSLTSALTGIRAKRPITLPHDTTEPLRKRRRETVPDGFENPHGYYQLLRNWYREESLARRYFRPTDEEKKMQMPTSRHERRGPKRNGGNVWTRSELSRTGTLDRVHTTRALRKPTTAERTNSSDSGKTHEGQGNGTVREESHTRTLTHQ